MENLDNSGVRFDELVKACYVSVVTKILELPHPHGSNQTDKLPLQLVYSGQVQRLLLTVTNNYVTIMRRVSLIILLEVSLAELYTPLDQRPLVKRTEVATFETHSVGSTITLGETLNSVANPTRCLYIHRA